MNRWELAPDLFADSWPDNSSSLDATALTAHLPSLAIFMTLLQEGRKEDCCNTGRNLVRETASKCSDQKAATVRELPLLR
jgi:hypothetical protein